jgi:predicted nucleic acid-binding protein
MPNAVPSVSMRLYLDTCSLNRPWDDQAQVQVHLEAEAMLYIIDEARLGQIELVTSDYLLAEMHQIPDPQRRADVLELTTPASLHMAQNPEIESRATDFAQHNILGYDALHIAAAEAASADYLITTDKKLINRARRAGSLIKIILLNPLHWPPGAFIP